MSRLDKKTRNKIKQIFGQTGSIRATARQVEVSRNTVRRHIQRLYNPETKVRTTSQRPSKLDPYKAKIQHLVQEKKLSAVRVLEEIKAIGYEGGYSILKDYIRTIRPKSQRGLTTVIDHPPGHEAQMDWSPHKVMLGGREQIVHTGSIVLCFSRWLYLHFFLDETIDSVIRLHEGAFQELGAVPATITYDNMTTVGFHKGSGKVWINPRFKTFAEKLGFEVIILRPGAKDRHGMVERPFHYIENNFLAGREFADTEDLNRRGALWRQQTANVRIHGTLREQPMVRLKKEMPFLKPLPHILADTYYREVQRLIHRDFCVVIDTNRYSASPKLFGKQAQVRLYKEHLEIWVDNRMDCKHTYCCGRHQRQVLPEHEAAFKKMTSQSALLQKAFFRLGKPAQTYYEGLKKEKGAAAGYHLQRILKLADRHGSDVVAGAICYAQRYGAFSAEAICRIIYGRTLKKKAKILPKAVDVPENIKQWLRSCAVEKQDLDFYDRIISKMLEDEDEQDTD
jgi:transposase